MPRKGGTGTLAAARIWCLLVHLQPAGREGCILLPCSTPPQSWNVAATPNITKARQRHLLYL